jgi:hypothetical protein
MPCCSWDLKCGDWRIGYLGVRTANSLTLDGFYWLLLLTAYTIGPISAEQHKQIGIRNENFENSQELKGRSENFKK